MGRISGLVSAIALLAGIGLWSTSTLVTKAAVGAYGAATLAERFPQADEMFRQTDFITAPYHPAPALMVTAWGKADRLVTIGNCGQQQWPFLGSDCFKAESAKAEAAKPEAAKPAPQPQRTVTIERRPAQNTSELVRVAVAGPPAAAMSVAPTCKQNLAAAGARLEHALAHLKGMPGSQASEMCATYRRDFFEVVKAREVTALCKTGAERDHDLGAIDLAVENLNGAIAQRCGS
jgi:hypothetical protein